MPRRVLVLAVLTVLFVGFVRWARVAPADDWTQFKSDLIASLAAVALGIPAGLELERLLERAREARERAEQRKRLKAFLDRVKFEIRDNEQTIGQILEKLALSKHARLDLADWAAALGRPLSVGAYDDLTRSGFAEPPS